MSHRNFLFYLYLEFAVEYLGGTDWCKLGNHFILLSVCAMHWQSFVFNPI